MRKWPTQVPCVDSYAMGDQDLAVHCRYAKACSHVDDCLLPMVA
jgi:hypothetical protein